jgi:uncharacterized protein
VTLPKVLWSPSFEQDEDDCACVNISNLITTLYTDNTWDMPHQSSSLVVYPLDETYLTLYSPRSSVFGLVVSKEALKVLQAFTKPTSLTKAPATVPELLMEESLQMAETFAVLGFLEPSEVCDSRSCNLNSSNDNNGKVSGTQNETLTAWLHLTDRCNLRCAYCYLPHVREDMSPETGRAAIDATFRSAIANGFRQIKLKYAGGEPLLRFPLIAKLHRYAQSQAREHSLDLEGVVLSNGTLLTVEMVETLKSLNLRQMISLDGLSQYHDSHRSYAGGRGSFEDVSEAVDLALANGLIPNISVTVSSRTSEGLPDVMAWILERELPFSLNFYRENELSASNEDMRLDEEKIINGMLATFKVIENDLPRRPFLGGIIDRANLSVSHKHTCGVGQNYLVFDQNGQVAKCQMHIRKPTTDIHAADPLAVIRTDQIGIQNLSVEEKEGCKTCEWKHWCTGGCPLATYRATGRYDVKSPNCNIYKALFPEALRLEGLRLLKYQDDPEIVQKIPA